MAPQTVDAVNLGYVRALLDVYLTEPDTLDPAWRGFFRDAQNGTISGHPLVQRLQELQPGLFAGNGGGAPAVSEPPFSERRSAVDDQLLAGVAAAMALVKAYRTHGHLAARLDPLGSLPLGDPSLEPENLTPPLTPELQRRVPARFLRIEVPGTTLADALPHLRATYCGTMA